MNAHDLKALKEATAELDGVRIILVVNRLREASTEVSGLQYTGRGGFAAPAYFLEAAETDYERASRIPEPKRAAQNRARQILGPKRSRWK